MNEVELLQQLRAGLPAARPESRAAARAGLMARIEHSQQPTRSRPSLWRRPRLRLAVAGVALAAVLIALPISLFDGGGTVQPAVGQVLHQAAAVAATQEPLAPGPGQYLFTRSRNAYLQTVVYSRRHAWSVLVPKKREVWISFDDSRRGRVRHVSGKPRFVSADQRAGWLEAGSPPLPRAGEVEDSPVSGSGILDASELPTDPEALREMLEAREIPGVEGPPGEAETFTLIGDMLRETYLPADIRAAIYELTAELPKVELLGKVKDPVGRSGTGIAFTDRKDGIRHELIFDPATSALLGERDSIVRSGAYGLEAPPGTAVGYAAYLESKVVDSVGRGAPAGAGGVDTSVGCYDQASLHADTTILQGTDDSDPIATCARLWREGVVDTRLRRLEREGKIDERPERESPHLVACSEEGSFTAHVFPSSDPAVCSRLGLAPFGR